MPVVILVSDAGDERHLALPPNATLRDALLEAGVISRSRGRRWPALLGARRREGPEVRVLAGHEGLTPPTPLERRIFGGLDESRRLAARAGLVGEAEVRIALA